MDLHEQCPVVFAAQSKQFFYCSDAVCEFVLRRGLVPIHPFKAFDYFLSDRVDRDLIRRANFNIIRTVNELWVFGREIANGVGAEIIYAREQEKPIRFFSISARAEEIVELSPKVLSLELEDDYDARQRDQLVEILRGQHAREYGSSRR
jgi:hypothetical protein